MISDMRPLIEVNHQAIRLLYKELGVVDAIRFLRQFTQGYGNYTQEREYMFADKNLENIFDEIENQRGFLKQSLLTENQLKENVDFLIKNYAEIISIKLAGELALDNEDKDKISAFYGNMIEGIKKNTFLKETENKDTDNSGEQQVVLEQ